MCMPHMNTAAPAPSAVPSMQAASGLDIGGAPRGAAQLGRLKLRLGGAPAPGAAAQDTPPAPAAPLADALGLPGTTTGGNPQPVAPGQPLAAGSFQSIPNRDLRLSAQ